MKILNISYNRKAGGLEEAFINYSIMLKKQKHKVFCILPKPYIPNTKLLSSCDSIYKSSFIHKKYLGFLLYFEIKSLIAKIKPDLVIMHNERNFPIIRKAIPKSIPLIAVNHGCKMKHIKQADYVFTINNNSRENLIKLGFNKDNIFVIPNVIDI